MLTYQGLLSPLASPQAAVVSVATAVPGGRRGAGGRRGTAANDNLRNHWCVQLRVNSVFLFMFVCVQLRRLINYTIFTKPPPAILQRRRLSSSPDLRYQTVDADQWRSDSVRRLPRLHDDEQRFLGQVRAFVRP